MTASPPPGLRISNAREAANFVMTYLWAAEALGASTTESLCDQLQRPTNFLPHSAGTPQPHHEDVGLVQPGPYPVASGSVRSGLLLEAGPEPSQALGSVRSGLLLEAGPELEACRTKPPPNASLSTNKRVANPPKSAGPARLTPRISLWDWLAVLALLIAIGSSIGAMGYLIFQEKKSSGQDLTSFFQEL